MDIEILKPYLLPILIIGFMIYRWLRFAKIKAKLPELIKNGAQIVDVRTKAEFMAASNPQSQNVPLDVFENKLKEFNKQTVYILCCASGARSGVALGLMKKAGFRDVVNAGPWQNTLSMHGE